MLAILQGEEVTTDADATEAAEEPCQTEEAAQQEGAVSPLTVAATAGEAAAAAAAGAAGAAGGDGGQKAEGAEGAEVRRVAPDGVAYTHAEFIEFYGGTAEWDAAADAAAAPGDEVGEPLSVPGPDYPGGGWVQQASQNGSSYYYNLRTGARQTERPDEDQIDRS